MKENTQEKNLVEKSKNSLFGKLKIFFKSLFKKKEPKVIETIEEESVVTKEENEFKENIRITEDEETKLLALQRKYREGEISQDDLTDEQIDALCDLYDKQIAELKITIENTKKQIEEYDRQIEKKKA